MKKVIKYTVLMTVSLLCTTGMLAKENVPFKDGDNHGDNYQADLKMKFGADCEPASQSADLDVNNVRTKILNGGDMWWDLANARYEIPKISDANAVRKNSLFSGAIWLGGEDQANNLRLAAMTYRQRGSDFWPGPLDPANASTNPSQCERWDKIFKVEGEDIIDHAENFNTGNIKESISSWPAEVGAPYKDVSGTGVYEPTKGDYPILREVCNGIVQDNLPEDQPDQMLWWIYNDNGNIHTETQGDPIGVEMQTTAFAFSTNDEVNDMTFYTTRIINRAQTDLENTYFGQWVDADLGNYVDDYVGCDVGLSLGFCYNGDDNDEGVLGYGLNPPSVGVDFFEGPRVVDPVTGEEEELGLSKFVYYNNNANSTNGNPRVAPDYYNYLSGRWMNGAEIEFGGDGITGTDGTKADYMFPFDTDPAHPGKNWNEKDAGNVPADRRFLQSSGPFVLNAGSVQRLTVGVVWARAPFGGAEGSLDLLKLASRTAQQLFNSCFDLVDGPSAPDVEIHEQDQQIVLSFGNTKEIESYQDTVRDADDNLDIYNFQGYRVFQLKDGSVSLSQLNDLSKAREVFQCDIQDGFDRMINVEFAPEVGAGIPVLKVEGENLGISHTVRLTEDAFATGSNKRLVNFKDYHYIILSYAASPTSRNDAYLEGRKVEKIVASPHKGDPKFGGSSVPSFYGDGPELVRLSGVGNGTNIIELKSDYVEQVLREGSDADPVYENGVGPVNIKVIDPLKVPKGDFELSFVRAGDIGQADSLNGDSVRWILVNLEGNDTIYSDTSIGVRNEQIILESTTGSSIFDWGMAVTIDQAAAAGTRSLEVPNNGLLDWSVEFQDPSQEWLTAVTDRDATAALQFGVFDWIRSGTQGTVASNDPSWHDAVYNGGFLDRNSVYEGIWEGRIAPYRLLSTTAAYSNSADRPETSVQAFGFAYSGFDRVGLENLTNVDLVITPDESLWSECVMIEMGEDPSLNQGGVEKFRMRTGTLNYKGRDLPRGKTIFPGYAINIETGERLNIIVGEDTYLGENNGRDMKWNPTDDNGFKGNSYPRFGGRHFIYVMGSHVGFNPSLHPKGPIYGGVFPGLDDGGNNLVDGKTIEQIFAEVEAGSTREAQLMAAIYQNVDWVIPTIAAFGTELQENADGIVVPPTEVRIRLRVAKPFGSSEDESGNEVLPKFKFNTDDIFNEVSVDNGKAALDLVGVVPNPYYAFSGYEASPLDNRIKFINLPPKCDISIYTLDGALVRRIKKDDPSTEADWNLKNSAAVPIASGLYVIHVDAGELGEKVLKWMGVMRELDLDSF